MPPELRCKIILESQDSGSDTAEVAQEGLVLPMVEQLDRNATNFLQDEYASDNSIRQEAGIGNVDSHVPNAVKFQALIDELKKHNTLVA